MNIACLLIPILIILGSIDLFGAQNPRSQTNRADSLKALCARLAIGPGSVVADVGCGDGPDTMVFAAIVGERGTVLAEEIEASRLAKVNATATKLGHRHIVPVLGQSDDPRLPDGFADLIYMNRVFHHFARPQAMLQRMREDLKPGGFLVVVDQQKGPLTDAAPLDSREKQHHWTSETTVVRLAREAGFLFHEVLDDLWHEPAPFVLVFRKPTKPMKHTGDPDPPQPLDVNAVIRSLPLAEVGQGPVVFFGLDEARAVAPALQAKLAPSSRFYDVVLQEWAISRDELPPGAPVPGAEVLRTEKGDLALPAGLQPGLVFFLDAYHRVWDPAPLLRRLKEQMAPGGRLIVLDRKGPDGEPRRLANHRRRLSPEQVKDDLRQAGWRVQETLPAPARDRFILVFTPDASAAR